MGESAVLRVRVVGSGGTTEGTCFLVHQDRREHDVVHYFLTPAPLLDPEALGERRTASLGIRVLVDDSAVILERVRADRPDLAIVDLSLGMESGLQLAKTLDASLPDVRVLILSMHDETLHAERALAAGARGYIMKQEAMQHLIAAIRCVASGKTYVSAQMSERIVARITGRGATRDERAPLERLTARETGPGIVRRRFEEEVRRQRPRPHARCHPHVATSRSTHRAGSRRSRIR